MMADRIVGGGDRRDIRGVPGPHGHFFCTARGTTPRWRAGIYADWAQAEGCTFESMAAVVEDGCVQQFQHFISNSPWDHEPVVAQIGADADCLLGGKRPALSSSTRAAFPSRAMARSRWPGNGRGGWGRSTIVRSRCL